MKIKTKLEKVKRALLKYEDIERIELDVQEHPFLLSRIIIFYKDGGMRILHFTYHSSPTIFIRNYNNYRKMMKEVEKDE